MKKDIYDLLRDKTRRIVLEGRRLYKRGYKGNCNNNCASCLAAKARGNVDKKDFGIGFDSREDICMLEARDILSIELKLPVR